MKDARPAAGTGMDRTALIRSSSLGSFFVARLRRLLTLRGTDERHLNEEESWLLDHAIYSTYRDLRAAEREPEARALLTDFRREGWATSGQPAGPVTASRPSEVGGRASEMA